MPKNKPDYQVRKFDLTKKRDLDTLSELAGDSVEANLAVGTGYFRIKRYRDALPHLEYAASLGSSDAKAHLAEMYYYGFGVDEDKGEALRLNVEAAEDGNLYSTYTLGMMYLRGVATEADPEKRRILDAAQDIIGKTGFRQIFHPRGETADPGKNEPLATVKRTHLRRDHGLSAQKFNRLLHGTQIPHSVIDDPDHSSIPLEEGTLSETTFTASRTHSASALKIASAM